METIDLLYQLAQQNAQHIEILNREMGAVQAQMNIVMWFIGINVVAWVGAIVTAIVRLVKSK